MHPRDQYPRSPGRMLERSDCVPLNAKNMKKKDMLTRMALIIAFFSVPSGSFCSASNSWLSCPSSGSSFSAWSGVKLPMDSLVSESSF